MSISIAICNQKGGVGKSTTAVNVGAYLALEGKKTLLFDLDPQCNATVSAGIDRTKTQKTAMDVLLEQPGSHEAIIPSSIAGLDLIPSRPDLAEMDFSFSGAQQETETVLKRFCDQIRERYDFILYDCPPSLGLLTVNALAASDQTLIPVQCEYLALEGLTSLLRTIDRIKERLNPTLKIGGIVLTMADFRANLTREVADEVKRFFKELVFETAIPRNVRLAEAPSFGKPICAYDPHSTGAIAYAMLAKELVARSSIEAATTQEMPTG